MLVCFVLFRTRGCGRIGRPAFPAPSEFQGRDFKAKLARKARRDREAVFAVIARSDLSAAAQRAKSEATEQSILPLLLHGLLRGACHRARIRATRWLAMTVVGAV